MKVLIINPNSDPEMTGVISRTAEAYADGRFEVLCLKNPTGPAFIDSYQDQLEAWPGMFGLLQKHEAEADAVLIACMDDPNLEAMKEVATRPVVGAAEAAMKIASMLGHRFSIVSTSREAGPAHEAAARACHLEAALASVRAPDPPTSLDDEEAFFRAARQAVQEDGAEVIVLGCAGLAEMARRLEKRLQVPVLDGVVCGLIIASGLARAGLTVSRAGRYRPRAEPGKALGR